MKRLLAALFCCAMSMASQGASNHWSFQPIAKVSPPRTKLDGKMPLDAFILQELDKIGLKPAPPADPQSFIRRVTFDLIGLPPTVEDIDAFLNDRSPDRDRKLIDRLLASPHYGERWGRHWLDVVRFAESDGFEHDAVRPHAWRYRDYVITAFNQDKPYDRFILEQLAGDELFPNQPEAIVATAFNLLGPDMVDSSDQVQRRLLRLSDMTDTTGVAFLGLTLGCARCHDHKFEPITQRDYYSLLSYFTGAEFKDDLPVPDAVERANHEAALEKYQAATRSERERLEALEAPHRKAIYERKLAKLSPEAQAANRTPPGERTTEQLNQVQETAALLEVTEKEIVQAMPEKDRAERKRLIAVMAKIPKPRSLPMTLALQPSKKSAPLTHVLLRGDYNRPGDEVSPAPPSVLFGKGHPASAESMKSRRALLANWIANPDNPLTARVIVNRVWQRHFGRGLVATPSDFGLQGARPSHPELLDWLASEFIAHGWSIKQLHRLILSSATYQQSSLTSGESLAADPDNRLYSRFPRLRLEAEVIRDSLLAIGGDLNRRMGGPGVFPPIPEELFEGAKGWSGSKNRADHYRRSVYVFARRNLRFPFLEIFDAPDSNLSCAERLRSTSAPQSLALLNAEEVLSASRAAAARISARVSGSDVITEAYRLVLGKKPDAKELQMAEEFLRASSLAELCRALMNLNAFVYVD